MKVIKQPETLAVSLKKLRLANKTIGLVPTMGALHAGHLSLIRAARKENKITVVSIFINPAQFGQNEDFKKYPRPVKQDLLFCKKEKVDFVFLPDALDMYPNGFATYCYVEGLSEELCGKSRPGHFRAVATIVAKLFNIVQPDIAYFGQKDAQQVIIIRKMAQDLNFPVKVKVMPTVREKDGLALSSRNRYLTKQERGFALVLSGALNLARILIKGQARDTARIISRMKQLIKSKKSAKIDYVEIVDVESLKPLKNISGKCLIALAVRIGKTRLIDNIICKVKSKK